MAWDALGAKALALERRLQGGLQRSFERRLGIETARNVDLRDLGIAQAGRIFYVAAPAIAFRAALRRLRPVASDVFVDLGSGKGQAVIVAAMSPLGKVIGVELSEDLTSIARANVESARPRLRCPDIELISADALEWPVPDDLSVVYMYSPFIGDLLTTVLERLFASFDARPRPLFVIYGYPWEHNWLVQTGRVRTVDVNFANWPRRPGWWDNDHVIVTYQVTSPDGSAPERQIAGGGFGWRKAMEYWSRPNDTSFVLYPPRGGAPLRSG